MRKFDIYVEGYSVQEGSGKAHLLAIGVKAESFIEAVKKWYNALKAVSDVKTMYGELMIKDGVASLWGCRLFDNYRDAAKSFG